MLKRTARIDCMATFQDAFSGKTNFSLCIRRRQGQTAEHFCECVSFDPCTHLSPAQSVIVKVNGVDCIKEPAAAVIVTV